MTRSMASIPLLPRSPARAIGACAALAAILLNVGCNAVRYSESFTPEGEPTRVIVHSDAGVVEVVAGDELRVERDVRAPEAALRLSHTMVDGVLMLEARCATLLPCAVDTRLTLPAAVPVEIDLGVGEVWVTGITDLRLELDEGDADIELSGDLQASVGSGDLQVRMAAGRRARVAVGRGDITVDVPDSDWEIDAEARELRLRDVQHHPGAPGRLELNAPSGTVTVQRTGGFATR
ncbi:MAG: hypothetical protein D6798_05615 [Deltaproteobacteria bacterium]|nr:MAG: hypothetical protein D6798_05615 [Deltaproteobacteria bacterium]